MSAVNTSTRAALDEIGLRFGTDKASQSHDFLRHYEFFLQHFRDQKFTLLELGVGPVKNIGKSLMMWREFFPRATIVGVDDKPIAKTVEGERISVEIGDLGQVEFLKQLAEKYKPLVIIDDASHLWSHQIMALEMLFPSLLPNGCYIVEDLHTSYGELATKYGQGQYQNAVTYLTTLSTLVCGAGRGSHESYANLRPSPMQMAIAEHTDTFTFCRHTAILTKRTSLVSRPARLEIKREERADQPAPSRPAVVPPLSVPLNGPGAAGDERPSAPLARFQDKRAIKYLFVGGPQRSGTTAFAAMMNRHPQIAIGIERYKNVYGKLPQITPDLFEAKRFSSHEEGEADVDWKRYGGKEQFGLKLARALCRGDKLPHIMRFQRRISEGLPDAKFLIMYRDIHRVCASWNRRALDEKDNWLLENDFRKAVEVINDELSKALQFHKKSPDRCLLVRYENVFGEAGQASMTKILDWLGLKADPSLLKALQVNNDRITPKIMDKPLLELEGQRDFVLAGIEWETVREIEALAV